MPHDMFELINMTNIYDNVWVIYGLSNVTNMHANMGAPRGMFDMTNLTNTLPNAKAPHSLFDLTNFGCCMIGLIIWLTWLILTMFGYHMASLM